MGDMLTSGPTKNISWFAVEEYGFASKNGRGFALMICFSLRLVFEIIGDTFRLRINWLYSFMSCGKVRVRRWRLGHEITMGSVRRV